LVTVVVVTVVVVVMTVVVVVVRVVVVVVTVVAVVVVVVVAWSLRQVPQRPGSWVPFGSYPLHPGMCVDTQACACVRATDGWLGN